MDVKILELIEGAKLAKGVTVVIDVFRAMTVESYLVRNNVFDLIPMGNLEDAYAFRDAHPGTLLVGEREGKKCMGFDYGNSPSQIKNIDFSGKTVVHTTSAGTQGIANAINASEILLAGFVNANATAEYIKRKNPEFVSLVCMGLAGMESTKEDTLCAEYIKSILTGNKMNLTDGFEECKRTSGAKFFDTKLQDVFPEEDFYLSLQPDIFDFALCVKKGNDGFMHTIKKII